MRNWRTLILMMSMLSLFAAACGGAEEGAEDVASDAAGAADSAQTEVEEATSEMTSEEETSEMASEDMATEMDTEAAAGGGDASGTIDIDGSSTVAPLTDAIAEEYAAEAPDVTVNVGVSGTGGGFERFCGAGDTQISNASRPISEEEIALCEENGIEYTEVRVGTDALTMVVNPAQDYVTCLTTEEVTALFGPENPATTWDQVNPEFPPDPVVVFAPGADSGTYDFMVEDVLDAEGSRQDYTASEDDNTLVQGITGTPGAWGFFGFAYFQEAGEGLSAVEYDAGEGCVGPSIETAQDDSYGLTRPLFIYVRNDEIGEGTAVNDFVNFYLENVNSLIEDVGYIPAPEETIEESIATVEAAATGGGGTTDASEEPSEEASSEEASSEAASSEAAS